MFFNITDSVNNTLELTTELSYFPYYTTKPIGTVVIPDTIIYNSATYTVKSIGDKAFSTCDSITSILLPNTITSIGDFAFLQCIGLTSITIPNLVSSIGDFAFAGCIGLTSIISNPIIPPTLQDSTFYQVTKTIPVNVPFESLQDYETANIWSEFTNFQYLYTEDYDIAFVMGNNAFFFNITDDINHSIELTTQLSNPPYYLENIIRPEGALVVPQTVIYSGIPYQVVSIGDNTFTNCNDITSLAIPNTVISIGENAFNGCININRIISNPINPPTISATSFEGISKTIQINVPCPSLQDYQTATNWQDFINYQCFAGLNDILSTDLQTKLYPNPTSGQTVLEIEGLSKKAEIQLIDIQGRILKSYTLNPNSTTLEMDLRDLSKGLYNVRIDTKTNTIIKKIIKE